MEFLKILNDSEDCDNNKEIKNVLYFMIEINKKYEKINSEIKQLNISIEDKLSLIHTYNKIFLNSITSKKEINFIKTLIVEQTKENNPYKKAINFVKEIISNIKEHSRLFEIFLHLDSNPYNNLLEENDILSETFIDINGKIRNIHYDKNPTEYGTNMANVEEVKIHLNKLMPKYIIRLNSEIKYNANYDYQNKIMILNEKKLFDLDSNYLTRIFEDEDLNEGYILPISMEILHELCGHGKIRLNNDKEVSPEEYRDSKYDYHRCHVKRKINESKIIKYPESGKVLESYISNDKKIIRWLKMVHTKTEIIKTVMDVKIWIGKDFNTLESLVKNYIESTGEKVNDKNIIYSIEDAKNDEEIIISDDDDTCGFHKYEDY